MILYPTPRPTTESRSVFYSESGWYFKTGIGSTTFGPYQTYQRACNAYRNHMRCLASYPQRTVPLWLVILLLLVTNVLVLTLAIGLLHLSTK
jgi:hypothetical protein